MANTHIKINLRKEFGRDIKTVKEVTKNSAIAKRFMCAKYEITDKGSEFMRCAIKTTLLLNVLHLSLPDNLLGFAEA